MAIIYRYEIKDKKMRKDINLQKSDKEIISVISKLFEHRLKDVRVTTNFFEFKLYESSNNALLRKIGKNLSFIFNGLLEENKGFIRMKQEFYAIVYPNEYENDNDFYIELIDVKDINDSIRIKQQAQRYLMNFKTKYTYNKIKSDEYFDISEEIKKSFYIDVLSSHIRINKYRQRTHEMRKTYFKVSGYHIKDDNKDKVHSNNNFIEIINFFDVEYLEGIDDKLKERSEKNTLKIEKYKKVQDKKEIEIIKDLEINIGEINDIKGLDDIFNNKDLMLTIHNVGQGLATSVGNEKEKLIYFDFGMGCNVDEKNNPKIITANISSNRIIILSHIHMDHWYRLLYEVNAFKCKWYMPDQDRQQIFNKRCAEIIIKGGSVNIIKNDIEFNGGRIILNGDSNVNNKTKTNFKHKNGISIKLEVKDEYGDAKNILISGDQTYNYMKTEYKEKVDILVATHHGGEYTSSHRNSAFKDIPNPRDNRAIVVYSYGNKNSYNHPSKEEDYFKRGWTNSKKTAIDGDILIKLK